MDLFRWQSLDVARGTGRHEEQLPAHGLRVVTAVNSLQELPILIGGEFQDPRIYDSDLGAVVERICLEVSSAYLCIPNQEFLKLSGRWIFNPRTLPPRGVTLPGPVPFRIYRCGTLARR